MSKTTVMHRRLTAGLAVAVAALILPPTEVARSADPPPAPTSVTIAGNLQSELGCPGDWQPDCVATGLVYDAVDGVWQGTFPVPAGKYEYKAALNGSWDVSYGRDGTGDNIPLQLAGATNVKFFYDHGTHWITDNQRSAIATAAGSFQSELGCPGDWQPDCLRSWLQDPDGDGTYTFSTTAIPPGSYEAKVALNEGWDVSYGQGGGGANIAFTVGAGDTVTVSWNRTTTIPTITVGAPSGLEPGDESLVRDPVRQAGEGEFVYFAMTDRFANGDPSNDRGGSASADPLVNGYLPTDKGFYHGGDLAGLQGKLDYLEGLGVTALWLTPPFTNRWVQGDGTIAGSSAGYHGYWQVDLTTIDPHLGTNDDMKALIADAHARGIKVYFDIVANHTGDVIQYVGGQDAYRSKADHPYKDATGQGFDDRDYAGTSTFPPLDPATSFPYVPTFATPADATVKAPAFLNDPTLYHNRGNSTFTGENSQYGDFFGLDDLFTEHPTVVQGMIQAHEAMISEFGIDGFRVDTVKHVNDEFWQAFVPAIRNFAAAEGKPGFVVFGEVFSGDPAYASRFSTELPFPGTLDFRFDETVKGTVAYGGATDDLKKLFAEDDWFTDEDSGSHGLVKFVGNHDRGRVGWEIDQGNPGATDAERVARATLVQVLNFTTRGAPVVYYGDEQGFTGDGGDKDARQDMFPSQVATYNDDDLIGTAATTADANFDTTHPLYQAISGLAALREANPALETGAQLHRYSEAGPGIYAFSRLDRTERVEYVVAVNTSETAKTATFATDSPSTSFTSIYGGGAPVSTDANRSITITVPPMAAVVYKAGAPVPADTTADGIAMAAPAAGAEVQGRTEVRADVTPGTYAEVTFAVSVGVGAYQVIGTDDTAPYSVRYDTAGLPAGTPLTFKAIVSDLGGNLNAAKVAVTVAEPPPPPSGTRPYAVIHYLRTDGQYGDHTTGSSSDFWGLHLWDGVESPTEWTSPAPFLGEDEYGRFAWVKLAPNATNVGFIVHKGDVKDGTDKDRFFDPSENPEIWLKQGDPTAYTSQAAAQGFATIHYQRADGDYAGWGLHLWGDAIADGVATEWPAPRPPDGTDTFGAYWNVPIKDAAKPLNYILHKGDTKDPNNDDQTFVPADDASKWIVSGNDRVFDERGEALGYATLHYHRAAGDYGDYTSTNYQDFWGLHTWGDADDPGWTTPRKPVRFDGFGPVFEVPLKGAMATLNYLFHRGDAKDPGPDQSLDLKDIGYEVWQLQGADPEDPYLLPMPAGGPVSKGNLAEQRAYWVSADTIIWPAADDPTATYRLYRAGAGGLTLTPDGVSGDSLTLVPGTADPSVYTRFPHLAGIPVLKLPADALDDVPAWLTGQVAVGKSAGGLRLDATGLQIPGVLDDLYAADAADDVLGVTWAGGVPTLRLWAPIAKSLQLQLFDDSADTTATTVAMTLDPDSGTWSATGAAGWKGKDYLFDVEVYVASTGRVEHNVVTDPYSVSLTTNSARSQVVDLEDPALEPAGWRSVAKPPLQKPEDIVLYELHVRDFSANDASVPADKRGTFEAFALENTNGTDHLEELAKAGLTHVHLLPVFDIATVNEDRSTWQQPDPATLAGLPPDSDQQQALVSATQNVDGFNWGYDPWHYTVPEGSYSTNPEGTTRIREFRDMVKGLNNDGLRVVMDVVYNHTTAGGQDPKSVLDRVVPGYYHRLDDKGAITTSTCCANTAVEHQMMEKLMIDSVVTWAREYKVDGFRFDLMGHHPKSSMLKLRAALDQLTLAKDGVDGKSIYLYGEGWNFGEVANGARFEQATQPNMAGTGIGTFNDRLRDAVRGGGPFDGGQDLVKNQGLVNGLSYDPNELNQSPAGMSAADQLNELLLSADQVRVGLAGNLKDFEFVDRNGNLVTGAGVDYNGSPTGYTADPQENIVYVEAHDNQTLFDISQYKNPIDATMAERVRVQDLGMDFALLSQGVPFVHAGMELLRSKSMDRDSYNSGDWFNRLDWTYQDNGWGSGLPVQGVNEANWPLIEPRLENPALDPASANIVAAKEHLLDLLEIRKSSPLFRLDSAALVEERLKFANTGPSQVPGLVVMTLTDPGRTPLASGDLDPNADGLVVLFNATDDPITYALPSTKGADIVLHPVQARSADRVVRGARFNSTTGTFTVPARTTAVFVDVQDLQPPSLTARLVPVIVQPGSGWFVVSLACKDNVTAKPATSATLNGVPVSDGTVLRLVERPGNQQVVRLPGFVLMRAPSFTLTATCTDRAGNVTTVVTRPVFRRPGHHGD